VWRVRRQGRSGWRTEEGFETGKNGVGTVDNSDSEPEGKLLGSKGEETEGSR